MCTKTKLIETSEINIFDMCGITVERMKQQDEI